MRRCRDFIAVKHGGSFIVFSTLFSAVKRLGVCKNCMELTVVFFTHNREDVGTWGAAPTDFVDWMPTNTALLTKTEVVIEPLLLFFTNRTASYSFLYEEKIHALDLSLNFLLWLCLFFALGFVFLLPEANMIVFYKSGFGFGWKD